MTSPPTVLLLRGVSSLVNLENDDGWLCFVNEFLYFFTEDGLPRDTVDFVLSLVCFGTPTEEIKGSNDGGCTFLENGCWDVLLRRIFS